MEIPYLQHQNSNLTEELPSLLDDVERELPWAAAAMGEPPEAVNLWIGDERAATTVGRHSIFGQCGRMRQSHIAVRGTFKQLAPMLDC